MDRGRANCLILGLIKFMAVSSKRTLLVSVYLPLRKVQNRSSFPKTALLTTLQGDKGTALRMAKISEVFKVFLSGVVGLVWRVSGYNKFFCKRLKRARAFFCGYSFFTFRGVLINFSV